MSPKKITQAGMLIAIGSIAFMLYSVVFLGTWSWWAVGGLGLAILVLAVAFFRGAYLAAQERVEMVDKLNDCYAGKPNQVE